MLFSWTFTYFIRSYLSLNEAARLPETSVTADRGGYNMYTYVLAIL